MAIQIETIATNRYAPSGADAINLYSNGLEGGSGLTLGQLAISVCMNAAVAYEGQSVLKMNAMTSGSGKLSEAAGWLVKVANGSANWAQAKAFCTSTLGIAESELPADLSSYDRRMQATVAMKARMDALTQSQQEAMIDLQTMVNRRDVAFTTSSNIIRALGTSVNGNAGNF